MLQKTFPDTTTRPAKDWIVLLNAFREPSAKTGIFELAITIVATIYASGVEDFNVLEWDRATTCQCSTCGHKATVADFDAGKRGAP